jgi:large subunit ribosomal protein L23Ae
MRIGQDFANKLNQSNLVYTSRHKWTTVQFRRPTTLATARKPMYPRKVGATKTFDKFAIIKNPLATESAMKKIEDHNTLLFIVDIRANKKQIKHAVEEMYSV